MKLNCKWAKSSPLPEFIAFDLDENHWVAFDKTSTYDDMANAHATSSNAYYAATIVDHYVFAATDEGRPVRHA